MKETVYSKRKYNIQSATKAKEIANIWLNNYNFSEKVIFGLPEVDDRYHIWRVPLKFTISKEKIGEVVIDAFTTLVDEHKTTKPDIIKKRIINGNNNSSQHKRISEDYQVSTQRNTIALGDAEIILQEMAAKAVDLIFTSPPYFNAKPEYSDYISYEEYLLKMRKIIQQCHRVLNEGRFFVMNVSPVLIRRANRNEASKRVAVPFDIHQLFIKEGFDFIDDIIWVKPEGAGWATGRGRRFAADRNPLQYKPVPVTEYVLVYRKHTNRLIDWNIRSYPDKKIVENSKILGKYETTNIWHIKPAYSKQHPAIFPLELAKRVIQYYSFKNDVVLDPFAGIGTVGKAASILDRRFVLIDIEKKYIDIIKEEVKNWIGKSYKDVLYLNCEVSNTNQEVLI